MSWSTRHRLSIGFALALLVLAALVGLSILSALNFGDNARLVSHTHQVLGELDRTLLRVTEAETGQRGYLITGDEAYLAPYQTALADMNRRLSTLRSLMQDNPAQLARLATLERAVTARLQRLDEGITVRRASGLDAARQLLLNGQGAALMTQIRAVTADMESAENALLAQRNADLANSIRDTTVAGGALTVLDFGLLALVFVLIRQDSRARTRAEAARLRVTLASIGDAVIATDTSGRVTFMNTVAEALTGWKAPEARFNPLATVFRIVDESSRAPSESPLTRVLKEGAVVGLANHTVLIARDGQEHPIDDSGAPIRDEQGTISGMVLVFRDVAERRAAEAERMQLLQREQTARAAAQVASARFAFLAEASAVLSSSLDYETTLASVARAAVPTLGDWCSVDVINDEGEIQRLAVAHVDPAKVEWAHELNRKYPPDPAAPTGVYHVIRTGEPEIVPRLTDEMLVAAVGHDPELLRIVREIGFTASITMPLLARGTAVGALTLVSAESGREYGPDDVALAADLARRAGQAIDNARLYRDAQAAIGIRDQFLSVASHELKTPLTSLLAAAQLVRRRAGQDGHLSDRDKRALQLVVDQATRLNHMLFALLDPARIAAGQLSLERTEVDLAALARRLAEEVEPGLETHHLVLHVAEQPVWVEGDPLRLEQVVQNLVQNAVKYTPSGGTITMEVAARGAAAVLTVTDTGIGIPEPAIPHLFSRFYRAPNVHAQSISGMGIGLYVVREIVRLHGGDVTVSSVENRGSTFTVTLPLSAAGAATAEDTAAEAAS